MWNQRISEMAHDLSNTKSGQAHRKILIETLIKKTQTVCIQCTSLKQLHQERDKSTENHELTLLFHHLQYYQTTQLSLTTIKNISPHLTHNDVESIRQALSTLRYSSDAYFRVVKDSLSPLQLENVSRYLDDISDLMKRTCNVYWLLGYVFSPWRFIVRILMKQACMQITTWISYDDTTFFSSSHKRFMKMKRRRWRMLESWTFVYI